MVETARAAKERGEAFRATAFQEPSPTWKKFPFVKEYGEIRIIGREEHMQKDPVCGMTVDEKKTKYTSEHEGRMFYFCSANCKGTFDKDPHRYGHPK